MDDRLRPRRVDLSEDAVAKAHAIYTPRMLSAYDLIVHGLSNRFAWRCPTKRLVQLYADNLSGDHLEAGIGTGFFLDRSGCTAFDRLVLLDINENCLAAAAKRLSRFASVLWPANLFEPLQPPGGPDAAPFASVGLTYVLHCLPGSMTEKLGVVDYLRALMAPRAVLFGATILGRGMAPNGPARALLGLYNKRGCSTIVRMTLRVCGRALSSVSTRSGLRLLAASRCSARRDPVKEAVCSPRRQDQD